MRGKHVGLSEIMFMKRITPADAGKTKPNPAESER